MCFLGGLLLFCCYFCCLLIFRGGLFWGVLWVFMLGGGVGGVF